MEPNSLQDLQDLIISSNYQESENKTWSIPVQILIDQYENSQDNDILCSGNFSFIIQPDQLQNVFPSDQALKVPKASKSTLKSRGTSTLHCCEHCEKEFHTKTLFVRHLKSHSGHHPYQCRDCEKTFKYPWLRDKHYKLKHCSLGNKDPIDGNIKSKGGEIHFCSLCQKSYPYLSTYQLHLKSHQDIKEHLCPNDGCGRSYRSISQLNDHIKSHNQGFICDVCNCRFRSRSALKSHRMIHSKIHVNKKKSSDNDLKSSCISDKQKHESIGKSDDISYHNMKPAPSEKYILCEKANGAKYYRCVVCPRIRSTNLYSVISHVCMVHTLEQISQKIIAEKYHRIS